MPATRPRRPVRSPSSTTSTRKSRGPRTDRSEIVSDVARRVRELRHDRGLTLRALAARSGVSLRFLMDVEGGRGNISVRRLADLAAALDTTASDLVATRGDAPARQVIALLGLRGAGKTTVGRRLARRRRVPFVELDREIERRAGLALGEIFSLHGEDFYRRLERETLDQLLEGRDAMVLSVGGGLVTSAETYALLRRRTTTVWLRARPEDYWARVIRQGDRRPIDQHPQAREALRDLIARREPLYARADVVVDTAKLNVNQSVDRVDQAVGAAG